MVYREILKWTFPTSSQVALTNYLLLPFTFSIPSWEAPGSVLVPVPSPHLPSRAIINPPPVHPTQSQHRGQFVFITPVLPYPFRRNHSK